MGVMVKPFVAAQDAVGADAVEGFPREAVAGMEPAKTGYQAPKRPSTLPSLCLWSGLLVCVARGFSSQLDVWRLLAVRGLWNYPRFAISDQGVYHRLARAGTAPLEHLF